MATTSKTITTFTCDRCQKVTTDKSDHRQRLHATIYWGGVWQLDSEGEVVSQSGAAIAEVCRECFAEFDAFMSAKGGIAP
jgi:hypothetical protein